MYAKHVIATTASRDLSRLVQEILLHISQEVVRDKDNLGEVRDEMCESPPAPRGEVFPRFHVPQGAVRWYGDRLVRTILSWYWQNVYGSCHPWVWVSQFQLYIDYMLSGEVGPIKITSWQVGSDSPEVDLLNLSFKRRARWFGKVLKGSLHHHGVGFEYLFCRPESTALCLHTSCLSVPWCPQRLSLIDSWIFRFCPSGVRRTSQAIDSLPCAQPDDSFSPVWISLG